MHAQIGRSQTCPIWCVRGRLGCERSEMPSRRLTIAAGRTGGVQTRSAASWPTDLAASTGLHTALGQLQLQVKSEDNARTSRQKGLRPPAGTPRQQISVFYCILQLKLASGLKNPGLFKGSGKLFQGLPRGLRSGSPGPGAPGGRQEAPETVNVRFLL